MLVRICITNVCRLVNKEAADEYSFGMWAVCLDTDIPYIQCEDNLGTLDLQCEAAFSIEFKVYKVQ